MVVRLKACQQRGRVVLDEASRTLIRGDASILATASRAKERLRFLTWQIVSNELRDTVISANVFKQMRLYDVER